jgi:tRNA pseudouridine13 synthase
MPTPAAPASPGAPALALLPGPSHFIVGEDPAYVFSGAGEHLYVEIEKEGLTTDQVASALAKACARSPRDIGYAGRKDRWGITRQWFSIHFGEESALSKLSEHLPRAGRVQVLTTTRHGNKLRLGHLAGNRFRLGLTGFAGGAGGEAAQALKLRLSRLVEQGISNAFGRQRFGHNQATLQIARACARLDVQGAVSWIVDPDGAWRWGDALPTGFRHGPEGQVLGALRHGAGAEGALRAGGDSMRKLIASAGQSAIFNAVLEERTRQGLLHVARAGDLAMTTRGALFLVTSEELAAVNLRAAAGSLDARMTGPLPGGERLRPCDAIDAEERSWSVGVGIAWEAFARGGPLESPGERRALIITFRSAPQLEVGSADAASWLEFSLPSGAYATEVLAQLGIQVPEDRRGEGAPAGP